RNTISYSEWSRCTNINSNPSRPAYSLAKPEAMTLTCARLPATRTSQARIAGSGCWALAHSREASRPAALARFTISCSARRPFVLDLAGILIGGSHAQFPRETRHGCFSGQVRVAHLRSPAESAS